MSNSTVSTARGDNRLEPLVGLGPPLSRRDTTRYARHLALPQIGEHGQRRLRNARVLVIGVGGLGSPVLLYLAAAGVGTLGLLDDDLVEESNLQRQVIHERSQVGIAKVDSAKQAVAALDDTIAVRPYQQRLDADNALDLFRDYDLVIDGTDNFATRYLANDASELTGTPLIWGSVFRFAAQISVFWPSHGPSLRDLYPDIPDPASVPDCTAGGVLGALCGVVGSIMATEAIKLITGTGEPLIGRVMLYDSLEASTRIIRLDRDPDRSAVTSLEQVALVCAAHHPVVGEVPEVTPRHAMDALHAQPHRVLILDVRERHERDIVHIPHDRHVPLAAIQADGWEAVWRYADVPEETEQVIVYCKAGIRSASAARRLMAEAGPGVPSVANLAGGVMAWIRDVAPDQPQY